MSCQSACGERPILLMTQDNGVPSSPTLPRPHSSPQETAPASRWACCRRRRSPRKWDIRVNSVRVDARNPVRIVLRFAHEVIQLDSHWMIGVHALDSISYRQNYRHLAGSPVLEIVAHIPDDVRIVPVAIAEKLSVLMQRVVPLTDEVLLQPPWSSGVNRHCNPCAAACCTMKSTCDQYASFGVVRS